jgi:LysR family transcriptional regulator, glycine cleavage system transcriptional activator
MSGANDGPGRGASRGGPLLPLLQHFDAAARHLSFTRAAEELNVTQGAVSQQMRLLEGRLGTPLFRRLPRGLALTPEGAQLAATVRRMLSELDDVVARIRHQRQGRRLELGCPPSFAMLWLIPRIHRFSRANPDIEIRFRGEFPGFSTGGMEPDRGGLSVRYDPHAASHATAEPLMPECLLPVASPALLDARPGLASPEGLREATFLHDAVPWDGAPAFAEWREWIEAALPREARRILGTAYQSGHQYNLSQLALHAASSGQGVAIGRSALVLEDILAGQLRAPYGVPARSSAGYYTTHDVPLGETGRTFLAWLRAQCREFILLRREWLAGCDGAAPP